MRKIINLIDKRFGNLVVIKLIESDKWGNARWLCRCDCGNYKNILSASLRNGITKSCGCLKKNNGFKHGHARKGKLSKIYRIWQGMNQRCNDQKNKDYKHYGDRGIKVCYRWSNKKNGFENFYKDVGNPPKGKSLDRINNNKGYFPGNWRWATPLQQHQNTRKNRMENFNGKNQCRSILSKKYNINKDTLRYRLDKMGLSIEEALTIPIRRKKTK